MSYRVIKTNLLMAGLLQAQVLHIFRSSDGRLGVK